MVQVSNARGKIQVFCAMRGRYREGDFARWIRAHPEGGVAQQELRIGAAPKSASVR